VFEGCDGAADRVDAGQAGTVQPADVGELTGGVHGGSGDGQRAHGRVRRGCPGEQRTGRRVDRREAVPGVRVAAVVRGGERAADEDGVAAVRHGVDAAVEFGAVPGGGVDRTGDGGVRDAGRRGHGDGGEQGDES
jgi:hypothetical protein